MEISEMDTASNYAARILSPRLKAKAGYAGRKVLKGIIEKYRALRLRTGYITYTENPA
jgi:hypothetical protein